MDTEAPMPHTVNKAWMLPALLISLAQLKCAHDGPRSPDILRRAGAPKAASVTEDPVDSFLQDVALRKARLADNMQRYLELQQKSGLLLNQVSRLSLLSMNWNDGQ
jgi:hypothetical protein